MIKKIIKELTDNPTPYNGQTNAQVAVLLNAISIVSNRLSISGSELFGYTDEAEYSALTAGQKQQWLSLCGIESITQAAVPLIKSLFNGTSVTWTAIVKTETKTPFINVQENDVLIARAN